MAKCKLICTLTIKKWAMPVLYIAAFTGCKWMIGRWMFDTKVTAE